jgi:nicotinate-nucleotide pyrophosphorylase (carboxylating)
MTLTDKEIEAFVTAALAEDIGTGDLTSNAVVPADRRLRAVLRAREALVVAGLEIALRCFRRLDPQCRLAVETKEGTQVAAGSALAQVEGLARALLAAERTALNIVQHLSGVATLTRRYAEAIRGTGAVLLDTRKTIPGLRRFEKYAVVVGGGRNHRLRLDDGVLIKDNHIAAAGGLAEAVARARAAGLRDVEVECETLAQVEEALATGVTRVLLDNMSLEDMRRAVARAKGRATLEASGGITFETVRAVAETGVDFISVGRLTQSAPAVDIGLDYEDERAA